MKEEKELKELKQLLSQWQQSYTLLQQADAPLPPERVKELARRATPSPNPAALRRAARWRMAGALPVALLCSGIVVVAIARGLVWPWVAALLSGMVAWWQVAAEGRYLWLLRHDDVERYGHLVALRHAQRLLQMETRRHRRRQWLSQRLAWRPLHKPAVRRGTYGMALFCCLLLLWVSVDSVAAQPVQIELAGNAKCIILQCNSGDCATQAGNSILQLTS